MYGLTPELVPEAPDWRRAVWAPFIRPGKPGTLTLIPTPSPLGWATIAAILVAGMFGLSRILRRR